MQIQDAFGLVPQGSRDGEPVLRGIRKRLEDDKVDRAREQASLDKLIAQGYEVITDVDKGPFIEATDSVRSKFGSKFADLIARAAAVK